MSLGDPVGRDAVVNLQLVAVLPPNCVPKLRGCEDGSNHMVPREGFLEDIRGEDVVLLSREAQPGQKHPPWWHVCIFVWFCVIGSPGARGLRKQGMNPTWSWTLALEKWPHPRTAQLPSLMETPVPISRTRDQKPGHWVCLEGDR